MSTRAPGEDVEGLERALPVESIDGGIRREVCPLCRYETHQGHEEGCWADAALSTLRDLSRKLDYWKRENEKGLETLREMNRISLDQQAALEEARGEVQYLIDSRNKLGDEWAEKWETAMGERDEARGALEEARRERDEDVCVLGLCEIPHLFLHPDKPYRFVVQDGCEKCQKYAEAAKIEWPSRALSPQTEEPEALGCLWCDEPAALASNLCPQHREQFVTGKRAP